MHEMAIAEGIIDICLDTLKAHDGQVIHRVQVQVGTMTAVDPRSLHFCFDAVTKGTAAEGAKLDIETVPSTGFCLDCQTSFPVEDYIFRCKNCNSARVVTEQGKELRVCSIDMD